jgi:RNA polymerase sigma factor (sigma-70 family)
VKVSNDHQTLAGSFEEHRAHLRAVAYRMLGSRSDADDAVQESWLRVSRADIAGVQNLGGWLTTVVGRVCLDLLRSRKSRGEELVGAHPPDAVMNSLAAPDHDDEDPLDAMGPALIVVLDTLSPAERLAFVLHDLFAVPFDDIARIVERSTTAARQLASRARRRVQGSSPTGEADLARQRAIVDAFLAASRDGDFEALLSLLDPEAVCRADQAAVLAGAASELRGSAAVAETFKGRARVAQPAWVDGLAGAVWASGRTPRVIFDFTIVHDRIVAIELVADSETIAAMDLQFIDGRGR